MDKDIINYPVGKNTVEIEPYVHVRKSNKREYVAGYAVVNGKTQTKLVRLADDRGNLAVAVALVKQWRKDIMGENYREIKPINPSQSVFEQIKEMRQEKEERRRRERTPLNLIYKVGKNAMHESTYLNVYGEPA